MGEREGAKGRDSNGEGNLIFGSFPVLGRFVFFISFRMGISISIGIERDGTVLSFVFMLRGSRVKIRCVSVVCSGGPTRCALTARTTQHFK